MPGSRATPRASSPSCRRPSRRARTRSILQSIAPDGTRTQSQSSITVAIAEKKDTKPLVALTTPDKPTVVLSSPQAPDRRRARNRRSLRRAPPPCRRLSRPLRRRSGGRADAAARRNAGRRFPRPRGSARARRCEIATVEAEEGGRLFVSGEAAPGATVRLYLNESLIAPGGAGADGRVSFAIGGGVRPGDYRVRLDDVDPVSGEVRSRAEVEFRVPGR